MNFFTELMLRMYFTADVTVGRFYEDKERMFSAFARIFLLTEEESAELFALTEREEVRSVSSEFEYNRRRRMRQYCAMYDVPRGDDAALDEIVDLKGASLSAVMNYELIREAQEVRTVVCDNLTNAAENGLILGLCVLGVLQSEGIVFERDEARGLHMLHKAADWDSEAGILGTLYYDAARRPKYLARLRDMLVRTGRLASFDRVKEVYGGSGTDRKKDYLLLEKAFRQGIVKRDTYTKAYARLIYSEILGGRDKEAFALSANRDLFTEASALPLKLSSGTGTFDADVLSCMRPYRAEEMGKIACSLGNIDLRHLPEFRPLLVISDSRTMLERYAQTIAGSLGDANIERIEVNDIVPYDLEPTKSNIFVRSCDEDAFNAYFLFFRGEIAEGVFDAARNFLQSAKRSKFRLNHPSATLDLSAILPVCFCDRDNARALKPWCDAVEIADPTEKEKAELLCEILEEKKDMYGVEELTLAEGLEEKLCKYSADAMERMLDDAVGDHRTKQLHLTEELMEPYFKDARASHIVYGFGGAFHENHE